MPALDREHSTLLVIDIQGRLMPAIEDGPAVLANARRLVDAAALLEVPILFTEQNPAGLGPTVPELTPSGPVAHKMTFDAVRSPGFLDRLPAERAIVVAGCEAHVCVMQTVLGLLAHGRQVFVVRDALITTDKLASYPKAILRLQDEGLLPNDVVHRTSKSLNNILEADHGALKRVIRPTRGFQSMKTAGATLKGFEVMRMVRRGHCMLRHAGVTGEVRLVNQLFCLAA
jgi:nicotinamidase-related amidase